MYPGVGVYTSKTIQNELTCAVGETLQQILNNMKNSKYYSILADEVTDWADVHHLSLAVGFVDSNMQIREEFLDFITVEKITGESLSTAILKHLGRWGLDIMNSRGQGYDGSSNMSSSRTSVQGCILAVSPLAFCSHCQAHQLNLCVVKGCSSPQIRHARGTISKTAKFF